MAQRNSPQRGQYKTAKELQVEKVIQEIQQGLRVLVLMRGLPGSGKTFLAREIVAKGLGCTDYNIFIHSTDDYFMNSLTGKYKYDSQKLSDAHHYNKIKAYNSMAAGVSPVIIDNTNTELWEMQPYVQAAVNNFYMVEIVEPYTKWAFKAIELARRNSHNVSLEKLQVMLQRYDKNVTVEKLLGMVGALNNRLPAYRNYPPLPFNYPANSSISTSSQPSQIQSFDNLGSGASLQEVIYISDDDEPQQENTSPNKNLQGKHDLTSTTNLLESDTKKVRTYSGFSEKPCGTPTKTPSEILKARTFYPELDLSSWGLNQSAVSSWETWDVVNPLKCDGNFNEPIILEDDAVSNAVDTSDVGTNTTVFTEQLSSQDKILIAKNRDINEYLCNNLPSTPPKRTLLDKSSMTDDTLILENPAISCDDEQITNLTGLFPNIPIEYLSDVFEKCKGDINWAVDLLLDDSREILPVDNVKIKDSNNSPPESSQNTDSKLQEDLQDLTISSNSPAKSVPKNDAFFEQAAALKKHIEQNIDIDSNFYSEHLLKLKNQKQGVVYHNHWDKPSTSQELTVLQAEIKTTPQIQTRLSSESESELEIDSPENESDNEEIVELNLGENFVSQLETKLGFEEVMPQGFLPIVQVPVSLARQLYATYVESILGQMELQNQVLETIVKQDEEFALKLQEQDQVMENQNPKTPDLQEIMNEQLASNIYQKQTEEWKADICTTLATKMSFQKIMSLFPTINPYALLEVFHAYHNSYDETISVLMASTDKALISDPDGTIKQPAISETVLNEMKEAEEHLKVVRNTPDVPKSAEEYREEAMVHHNKHNELIQKAQQAYLKKQYPVAQFYSDIAKTHTQLYDQANNLAASAFLNEHSKKLQNFYTLDLHFLYVKEAVAALDMFIDKNIHLLSEKKTAENVFVITGRGNRSEQGRSKLKPVIMARLRKRKLRYWELNPGLLKIRILRTSPLTSNI